MTTPFVFTQKMDVDLLELVKTIIQPLRLRSGTVMKHWKIVHTKFKKAHAYTSSCMALYEHAKRIQKIAAAGTVVSKFTYTTKVNETLMLLEKSINHDLSHDERWQDIQRQFKVIFSNYKRSWKTLCRHAWNLRRVAAHESKVAAQSSQQSEGDKPQEESHPLPPATSDLPLFVSLDSFDSDIDTEYESDVLPESLVVFNVSIDMLKSFTNDPMDVFDDQEERIDQDEPAQDDQRVVKRRNITIRVDSDVSTPPQVSMLEVLTF